EMRSVLKSSKNPTQQIHLLWALKRLDGLTPALWSVASSSPDANLRNHSMRALAETTDWTPELRKSVVQALKDANAEVKRSAAQALASHPGDENIRPLLDLRHSIVAEDTHLLYVSRVSLRDQLSIPKSYEGLIKVVMTEEDRKALADVSLGVQTEESGKFLVNHILTVKEPKDRMMEYLRHAARFAPETELDKLAAFAQKTFGADLELQLTLLTSVQEGLAQRGAKPSPTVIGWGGAEAWALLTSATNGAHGWRNFPIEGKKDQHSPWFTQSRASADGDKTSLFLSSLPPGGEALTGRLRSLAFALPETITFYMAGHDGQPPGKPQNNNYARLIREDTGETIVQSPPPRNDTAQKITWDIPAKVRGVMGHIELVDQDEGAAYAWLAAGRFSEGVPALPVLGPSQVTRWIKSAAELCENFRISSLNQEFTRMLVDKEGDVEVRIALAKTLFALDPEMAMTISVPLVKNDNTPSLLRDRLLETIAGGQSRPALQLVIETSKTAPHRSQVRFAQIMAGTTAGAEELMSAVGQGHASSQLLLDRQVKDRILNLQNENLKSQWTTLTKGLTGLDAERQRIIDHRLVAFRASKPDPALGMDVFMKNCAVCHQLGGKGAVVGPQLDGVGNRGAERLCEDILDPNRNVDAAFYYSNVTLKDDQSFSGLFRGEKGATLIFVDGTGKELTVPKKDIKERIESHNSLMPENFYEVITVPDFNNLLGFLLSQGRK
ncbi:MAG: Cytochrome c, partial [Verrucomicrobiales bacterium]|nr:Cytochrome c [Verrucomicrobiales bacterium]